MKGITLGKIKQMETVQIKEQLHQYIEVAQEPQLQAIYILLEEKIKASQDCVSIEQYNMEIEASEKEYEEGNFISHEEFVKEIKQW